MSASSPYQSQLFQRLTQQSHRWSQQWRQTLHRGKMAAAWGMQALLFPLSVLFQGAQRGAKRLRQAVAQPRAQLSASGRQEQAGENPAARLETATPVPEGLAAVSASGWLRPEPLAFIQSLVGKLQRLSAWQPSGSLTQGGQASLPEADGASLSTAFLSFIDPPQRRVLLPRVGPQRFLVHLDGAVAALERRSGKLQHLWSGRSSITPPAAVGEGAFQIQTLIYAAIAYFFGRRDHTLFSSASISLPSKGGLQASDPHSLQGGDSSSCRAQSDSCRAQSETPDPAVLDSGQPQWVTWHDLFGRAAHPVAVASTRPPLNSPSQRRTRSKTLPAGEFPAIPPIPGISLVGDGINFEIETEAVFMGYVKHPLRQILECLDRIVAWTEKRLAEIWSNTRSFVAGFLGLPDRS